MTPDRPKSTPAAGPAPAPRLTYILNAYSPDDDSHFPPVLRLLEEIAAQGVEVTLLFEKADSLPPACHPRLRIERLRLRLPLLRHLELFVWLVRRIAAGTDTTFVRISAPASIVASIAHRLLGGRSWLWQSGTTFEVDRARPRSPAKLAWWLRSHLPSALARRLAHRFATGPQAMVDYYADAVGVDRRKIRLLYNDVDTARFGGVDRALARERLFARLGLHQPVVVLLSVHRLSPVRRSPFYFGPLFRALATQAPGCPIAVVLAGGGSDRAEVQAQAEAAGLGAQVHLLGSVPNHEVHWLYAAADLFIHPTYTEGFPRVLIEAMASQLPIVSTDAGGARDIVGAQQRRYVVDRRDPEAFAQATLDLLGRPVDWSALGRSNRADAARFATPAVAAMVVSTVFE